MRAVLDTNVWLPAVFWRGEAYKIIELAESKRVGLVMTKDLLLEITDVLNREAKFQKFLDNRKLRIEELVKTMLSLSELVDTKSKFDVVEDKTDNRILEAALDGKADYIVTYDKHLLNLKEFRGIRIARPKEFLALF